MKTDFFTQAKTEATHYPYMHLAKKKKKKKNLLKKKFFRQKGKHTGQNLGSILRKEEKKMKEKNKMIFLIFS